MKFDPAYLTLYNEALAQEASGELHKYSDQLTESFLYSVAKRKLLSQLADGKTLYIINWVWSSLTSKRSDTLPENYDTYVFLQYREPVDWRWFDQFAQTHPDQKIILLTQLPSSTTPYKNFQLVEHQWSTHYVGRALTLHGTEYEFVWPRQNVVSSLANKPSFFKTLITAYFHKNYSNRRDLVLGWNINKRKERCPSLASLENHHNRPELDEICEYYQSTLKQLSIGQEPWVDSHYENNNWTNTRAYTDTLINFTNETYSQGQEYQRTFPGPQMTEKTRKALLAGCAIVPVGMPGVYKYLSRFGLKFDYPWSCEFDEIPGDLDRMEHIFKVIDEIMSYDSDFLHQQVKDSIEHNYYHLRNIEYINCVDEINQQAIVEYLSNQTLQR
jgi:hypothetical protein